MSKVFCNKCGLPKEFCKCEKPKLEDKVVKKTTSKKKTVNKDEKA